MLNTYYFVKQGLAIFMRRLRTQGLRLTLTWLYGQGTSIITGIPMMRYSQITPEIFVGPQYRQMGKRVLENLGFSNSLSLRIEFDDAIHNLAMKDYCYVPVVDGCAPTIEQLHKGATFIHQAITKGEKIYIHCHGGIGRAPTMAAAYFVSQGLTVNNAIELIKQVRPYIEINPIQLEQLRRFEATIYKVINEGG